MTVVLVIGVVPAELNTLAPSEANVCRKRRRGALRWTGAYTRSS